MRCMLLIAVVFYLSALSIVKLNGYGLFSGRSIRYYIVHKINFLLFIALCKVNHIKPLFLVDKSVFLQDQNFCGSLMTPCLKIWGLLANLEGQNFFYV